MSRQRSFPVPRICEGCKKTKGTTCIVGLYWHPSCFRDARANGDKRTILPDEAAKSAG